MKTRKRFYRIRVDPKYHSINKTFDLVMEILKNPKLGTYVREIVHIGEPSMVHHYVRPAEQRDPRARDLSARDRELLLAAVWKAGFSASQQSSMLDLLMLNTVVSPDENREPFSFPNATHGDEHSQIHGAFITQALAAILISVSPNLDSLVMTEFFGVSSKFYREDRSPQDDDYLPLDRLLHRANANPTSTPYLQHLRKVYIIVDDGNSDGRFYMDVDFLECATLFDRLPSIESISTGAICGPEYGDGRVMLEPRSSNLSRIQIQCSALPTACLVSLIQSCKVLREVQYTMGGRCMFRGWSGTFDARTFIKSILPHKDTLEVLDIDAEHELHYFHPHCFEGDLVDQEIDKEQRAVEIFVEDDDERQMLQSFSSNSGSLKEFRALQRLSVGIGFLVYFAMGVRENDEPRQPFLLPETLPESLEYLCIRGYEKGQCEKWDAHIDALVASFDSGSSRIKEITGIEKTVPNSEDVENPDEDWDLLWIPPYSVDV